MRNLVVHRESQLAVALQSASPVTCVCSDNAKGAVVVITEDGHVAEIPLADGHLTEWNLNETAEPGTDSDASWFFSSSIVDTNSLLCVSHAGQIISIGHSADANMWDTHQEVEGFVDSGISASQWNPDQSSLVICTRDDSMLVMSPELEVLHEISTPSAVPGSACAVSWSGDGELCAVYSVDAADGIAKIRIYSKVFDLVSVGRGVMDGPASIVKDLCSVVAFSPNASLVASVQKKPTGKFQVVFFERNGLRHGEFDVRLDPLVTDNMAISTWAPSSLFFDLSSSLLAVGFRSNSSNSNCPYNSVVQIYYRENFHWYLKQQWTGLDLACHGFDSEVIGRLYLTECRSKLPAGSAVVRVIDLVWEATASPTSDCSIAVTDGVEVHMTPLGHAVVPPPMSLYRTPAMSAPPRHVSFWTRQNGVTTDVGFVFPDSWGLACLSDRNCIFLFIGEHASNTRSIAPLRSSGRVELSALLVEAGVSHGSCRQVLAFETNHDNRPACASGREINLALVVSTPRAVYAGEKNGGFAHCFIEDLTEDILIFARIHLPAAFDDVNQTHKVVLTGKLVMDGCTVASITHWGADGRNVKDSSDHHADFESFNGTAAADENQYIAASVYRADTSFAVVKVKCPKLSCGDSSVVSETFSSFEATSETHIIPELCQKVIVSVPLPLPDSSEEAQDKADKTNDKAMVLRHSAVIGLSIRNHLYCGEILIATGVSTFCVNSPLGTLLYATVGTRPTLNFIDLESLYRLDPMQSIDDLVQSWGSAEPRPLERGARIVASVSAAARVVLQMPRGNFETCEPRHLALKRAKVMMNAGNFYECLVFLRRQRIDLNLLFDYGSTKFLAGVPALVTQCLQSNPDLLSLLISSLEAGDVTRSKYSVDFTGVQSWTKNPIITHADKVNTICRTIRNGLLAHMLEERGDTGNDSPFDSVKYMNPVLCTYARQQPPRLAEALNIIKAESLGALQCIVVGLQKSLAESSQDTDILSLEIQKYLHSAEFLGAQPALSLGKAQSLIKYLVFLVNKEELFNAALGECDFPMSRAIAKQCQMDPKIYLPLLEQFESIGSDWVQAENALETVALKRLCHMKFRVYLHQSDFKSAATWGIRAVALSGCVVSGASPDIESGLHADVFDIIEMHDLHSTALPLIRELLGKRKAEAASDTVAIPPPPKASSGYEDLSRMLSQVLVSFGSRAMILGNYKEALSAFLVADPPRLSLAISAAKSAKDWKLAMSLAGRASLMNATGSSGGDGSCLTLQEIAASIVEDFEAGLEQGMSEEEDYFSFFPSSLDFALLNKAPDVYAAQRGEGAADSALTTPVEVEEDRAMEVALMCIEYLDNDVERAVAILLAGRKWMQAAQLAFRYERQDLVEQVNEAVQDASKDALAALLQRTSRHLALTASLKVCWGMPEERLKLVVESDPQLVKIIEKEKRAVAQGWHGAGFDDLGVAGETRSVIHNDTHSEYSRASIMSHASGASVRSGVSTVSVLSNLSRSSNTGSTVSDASSFSVRGLEHSLLSRGSAFDTSEGGKSQKSIEKKKKRHERHLKGNKGGAHGGADVYNLKGEGAWCTELSQYCDVKLVATAVCDLRDTLLLLGGGLGGIDLAMRLQTEMNEYATVIVSNPPPTAPLYPVEWLKRKGMDRVRCFQEWPATSEDTVPTIGSTVNSTLHTLLWWKVAADGIIYWRTQKDSLLDA